MELLSSGSLKLVLLIYITSLIIIGIWPFSYNIANGVRWVDPYGIEFHGKRGLVYEKKTPTLFSSPSFFSNHSFTIELHLLPSDICGKTVGTMCSFYDGKKPDILTIAQWKHVLVVRSRNDVENRKYYREVWKKRILAGDESRIITITTDERSTMFYVNGKLDEKFRNHSLLMPKHPPEQEIMVAGNTAIGTTPYRGFIYGLALYDRALDADEIMKHYRIWNTGAICELRGVKGIRALYPMNEAKGRWIHNAISDRLHLWMPEHFEMLEKRVLELAWRDLKLDKKFLYDVLINMAGFIPLGFLIMMTGFRYMKTGLNVAAGILISLGVGVMVSLAIELIQVYLPDRCSSMIDLACNTTGTGIGILAYFCIYGSRKNLQSQV